MSATPTVLGAAGRNWRCSKFAGTGNPWAAVGRHAITPPWPCAHARGAHQPHDPMPADSMSVRPHGPLQARTAAAAATDRVGGANRMPEPDIEPHDRTRVQRVLHPRSFQIVRGCRRQGLRRQVRGVGGRILERGHRRLVCVRIGQESHFSNSGSTSSPSSHSREAPNNKTDAP
jgi:hypothetical protein